MELNTINHTDKWGETATRLNENFGKIATDLEKAKLSTTKGKGLFSSLETLKAAYPSPRVGDWAVVGNKVPGPIYRCDTAGTWTATGEEGGVDGSGVLGSITVTEITDATTIV